MAASSGLLKETAVMTCLYCRIAMPEGSAAEQELCPSKNNKERHTPFDYNPKTGKGMVVEMEPVHDGWYKEQGEEEQDEAQD